MNNKGFFFYRWSATKNTLRQQSHGVPMEQVCAALPTGKCCSWRCVPHGSDALAMHSRRFTPGQLWPSLHWHFPSAINKTSPHMWRSKNASCLQRTSTAFFLERLERAVSKGCLEACTSLHSLLSCKSSELFYNHFSTQENIEHKMASLFFNDKECTQTVSQMPILYTWERILEFKLSDERTRELHISCSCSTRYT